MNHRLTQITRRRLLATSAAAGASLASPFLSRAAFAQSSNAFTVWVWGGAERFDARKATYARAFPAMADAWNIKVESPGAHDAEVAQQLRLALASGSGIPDLMQMNYTAVPEFAEAGLLEDLSDFMAPYADDLSTAGKALSTYKGQTIAIPAEAKSKVWYYRKDLFEAAGIDVNAVATFDDYMAAGQAYRDTHPDGYLMNIGDTPIHYWYFMMLSHWDDVRVADEDGTYRITSDPHFGEVLEWMKQWTDSDIAMPIDDWAPDWQPAFANGTLGGSLLASWLTAFLPQFAPEQAGKWGLALWPEFNRTGSEAGGSVFVVPKGSVNGRAAAEWYSQLQLSTAGAVADWEDRGLPPVVDSAFPEIAERLASPIRPDDVTDAEWAITPVNYFGPEFMDTIQASLREFKLFNYDPAAQAELDIMRRQTEGYIAGSQSLDEALEGMQDDMERQIGNPYDV